MGLKHIYCGQVQCWLEAYITNYRFTSIKINGQSIFLNDPNLSSNRVLVDLDIDLSCDPTFHYTVAHLFENLY